MLLRTMKSYYYIVYFSANISIRYAKHKPNKSKNYYNSLIVMP